MVALALRSFCPPELTDARRSMIEKFLDEMRPGSRNGLYVSIKAGGLDIETLAESIVESSVIPGVGDEDKIRSLCANLNLSFADLSG